MDIQWSGMQAYLVFNALALPLAFGSGQSGLVKLLISAFGLFMHLGLTVTTLYSVRLLKFWDESLAELEQLDQDQESDQGSRIAVFSHPNFWEHQEWPRLRFYLIPFGIGMFLWAYETLEYLQYVLKGGTP